MKGNVLILTLCIVICIILSPSALLSDDNSQSKETEQKKGIFQFDRFLMENVPGGEFYTYFIENFAPDATFLTEENNGFAMIDNPRVYFEGNSYTRFNWNYNGIDINSGLDDGSPALILPFSSVDSFQLIGESPLSLSNGMQFITKPNTRSTSRLVFSNVFSNVGGYWAKFMIQPSHPTERADYLYNTRRKIDENFYFDYSMNKNLANSSFQLGASYFDIKRIFNDFNTFDTTYTEDGRFFTANATYRKALKTGYYELLGVVNYLDRSNLGSETGSYPQETIGKKKFSFLTAFILKKKLELSLAFLFEKEDLDPFVQNYSKDLMDNDGDGLYPYGKSGENKLGSFTSPTIDLNVLYPLISSQSNNSQIKADLFGHFRYFRISADEISNDFNPILFDGSPYQVVKWSGEANYANNSILGKAGIKLDAALSNSFSIIANIYGDYNGIRFNSTGKDNNIGFLRPGIDAGIYLFRNKPTNFMLSIGILPEQLRENVNFFLDPNRPSGIIYSWNDKNGDKKFQAGEEGAVYGYTGGAYHFADENLKSPYSQRLVIYFTTPISRNFALNVKAMYKKMKNVLTVKFDEEYGHYETINGTNLYFFDEPFTQYYLTNAQNEKDPFYAQFQFDITGKKEKKWFFSFSFMAHMGMGTTAFGNGSGSNDIGILDESQANPNSWLNGYGRLDGDRGFAGKIYFGYYIAPRLFASVSMKYRDGDPFAFLNTVVLNGQRVIYYQTIKGEDEHGKKGGPREDYMADLSLALSYRFPFLSGEGQIKLAVYNILDIGAELSEYVYSGGSRDAMELQIPRSIRLIFGWTF